MSKLGYSSITLTDLTETFPVSLVLKSNKDNNIQTKVGNLYTPNFSEEELIITPSLFLGQEDLKIEENEKLINPALNSGSGYLYYEIGNERYEYNGSTIGNYVDIKGNLHIKENLNENITIEAYIQNYFNETHSYYIELISAINPINFLLMKENTSGFQAIIECTDGREFFEDNNASPITMTALLYKGKEIINEENNSRFTYIWNRLNDDSVSNTRNLTINRSSIFNRDYFTCAITDNETGIVYMASQFLYDFTDTYTCEISYNKMPLLIEGVNSEILLTTKVWDKETDLTSKEGFNLSYEWKIIDLKGNEEILQNSLENYYLLNSTNTQIPKENFIILCKVYQTDSENIKYQIASSTVNFEYISDYKVNISPQTIFIPTSSKGFYLGNPEKEYSFNFQLVDRNGNLLPFEDSNTITDKIYDSDGASLTFDKQENWNFTGTLNFTNSNFWENSEGSRAYDFTYTYAGQKFTEEIYIVKSYAGENGQQGFSGYTVDFSNEFFTFSGGESIADPNQITSCLVSSFLGGDAVEIKEIKVSNNIIYSKEDSSYENEWYNYNNNNLFIQANKIQNNQINITLRTNTSEEPGLFLTKIESVNFYITIEKVDGSNITFLKTFSYNINYNGKTYYLLASENSIHYIEAKHSYEPEFFTVQALFRETTGLASTYENGKILYSFDGEEWKTYNERIEGYSNLQNIYLRLYGSRANIDSNLTYFSDELEEFSTYLYDTETIPVLTSMEGYEFGGENLLRWSKTLPIESNKWIISEEVNIENSQDFSIAEWNGIGTLKAPIIKYEPEYLNEDFCLSFYITGDTNSLSIFLNDELLNSNLIIEEGENYKKAYCVFKLPSSITSDFNILFSGNGEIFKIKKPKLELGNIPTAWSASVYDIDYSNVVGENLIIPEGLYQEVKTTDPYLLIADELKPSTSYTFSCQKTSWDGPENIVNFYLSLRERELEEFNDDILDHGESVSISTEYYILENEKDSQQFITFSTPNYDKIYSLRIYAKDSFEAESNSNTLTLQQVKLELGSEVTPFFLDDTHLDILIKDLQNSNLNNSNEIKVLTEDKTELSFRIQSNQDEINALKELQNSYIKIDEKQAIIEAASTAVYGAEDGYLKRLKGSIEISAENATKPYIQISTSSADNFFATKIDDKSLGFYQGSTETPVASITGNKMEINSAKFNNNFSIGDLMVTITEAGVGFTW